MAEKNKADDLAGAGASAAEYFGKKKAGKDPTIDKMEEAAGITPTPRTRTYKTDDPGKTETIKK
jgi:hypothetical protein